MRTTNRDGRAYETAEEREARLQCDILNRLASETAEEREARLQRMSALQCDGLESETVLGQRGSVVVLAQGAAGSAVTAVIV